MSPTTLTPGTRLGPYEIVALLGVGGMGEVYRARDARLGRDVAVKVLPPQFANDPQASSRFEREARAVAALSHPNIVALFDIGREQSRTYVVTELLEGDTLRDRLERGAIPPRKALECARAVAEAIEAAHERGIVHRDLKPENIFLTADWRVKVLDFGIAQISLPLETAETIRAGGGHVATTPGTILGTVGYMAPEQLRGLTVDSRSDIFTLGAVLYELLTHERAFRADSAADTISAVLHGEPPAMPRVGIAGGTGVERIVRRCLEKAPAERFQSARDVAFALDAVGGASPPPLQTAAARGRRALVLAGVLAAAGALAIIAAAAFLTGRRSAPPVTPMPTARFGIAASSGWSEAASVSPDGKYIVYTGGSSPSGASAFTGLGGVFSSGRFWLRRTDSLDAQVLSDTDSATPMFFWSPDSRQLGYITGDTVFVRELPSGTPHRIAVVTNPPKGAAWGAAGDIVISTGDTISSVPASGGTLRPFLHTDRVHERWRAWPSFLPDGQRFLYTALMGGEDETRLETRVAALDGRELGTVLTSAVGASYADGHLLFGSHGALYAQRFDSARLKTTGERQQIAAAVAQDWRTGMIAAHASDTGVLVVREASQTMSQFVWFDRAGHRPGTAGTPDTFTNFDLSPDGRRVVVARHDPKTSRNTLWLMDLERGVKSLISDQYDVEDADDPTWTVDGTHLVYRHGSRLVMRSAYGGGERTLLNVEGYPDSFTRDGRFVVYGTAHGNLFEEWAFDVLTPGAKPIPLVTGTTLSDEGRFSPNGKWMAYHSNQSGTVQVHVIPFPATGENWQISTNGGAQPRWAMDGQELFYLDGSGQLMSVKIPDSDPRRASEAEPLFATGLTVSDALDQFAVARDRFLLRVPVSADANAAPIQVIVNWLR